MSETSEGGKSWRMDWHIWTRHEMWLRKPRTFIVADDNLVTSFVLIMIKRMLTVYLNEKQDPKLVARAQDNWKGSRTITYKINSGLSLKEGIGPSISPTQAPHKQ